MFRVSVLCSREAVVSHHADKKKPRSNAVFEHANHEPVYDVDYARIAIPRGKLTLRFSNWIFDEPAETRLVAIAFGDSSPPGTVCHQDRPASSALATDRLPAYLVLSAVTRPGTTNMAGVGGGQSGAEIYTYEAPWLVYAMNWSVSRPSFESHRPSAPRAFDRSHACTPPNLTRQRSDDDATLGTRPAVDPNPHALDATD